LLVEGKEVPWDSVRIIADDNDEVDEELGEVQDDDSDS